MRCCVAENLPATSECVVENYGEMLERCTQFDGVTDRAVCGSLTRKFCPCCSCSNEGQRNAQLAVALSDLPVKSQHLAILPHSHGIWERWPQYSPDVATLCRFVLRMAMTNFCFARGALENGRLGCYEALCEGFHGLQRQQHTSDTG
jgi:hypothetical protein